MEINKTYNGNNMIINLSGRLDTTTAPDLESLVNSEFKQKDKVTMDFKDLVYVSSAGLRVILLAQKIMTAAGAGLIIRNVNDTVMEVFEMTGFADILTIE